jgi:carboxymethylenebutenolidase
MQYGDIKRDLDSMLPGRPAEGGDSRRGVLRMALGTGLGYAVAAGPVTAQTAVTTPADGLAAGRIHYEVGGFAVPAYQAAPENRAGKAGLPVVLVVSEIFGVHEYIADVCRRLARAGYLAIAPDLFARQGDPASYAETARLMSELVAKVPDAQVMGDLDGAVDWAAAHGGDTSRLGITGFCWGGRIAWLYAVHGSVKAAVAWYGRLEGEKTALQPAHPVDRVKQLKAPVLGLYGGQDGGIPVASVERMRELLRHGPAAARASEFVVYPEAGHAFHADYRPSYREQAARDGWQRMLAWLHRHGVA